MGSSWPYKVPPDFPSKSSRQSPPTISSPCMRTDAGMGMVGVPGAYHSCCGTSQATTCYNSVQYTRSHTHCRLTKWCFYVLRFYVPILVFKSGVNKLFAGTALPYGFLDQGGLLLWA